MPLEAEKVKLVKNLREMKKWIIIGISGATCGGKTTLTELIQKELQKHGNCELILQDDFFYDKESSNHVIIPELNHANWECLESINWKSLMEAVNRIFCKEPKNISFLLIEGHIIYNYRPLEELFDKKLFITLNKEECWNRRRVRVYDPPDPPGYFEKCVWPMYLKNLKEVEENSKDVVFLNGADEKEIIFKNALKELNLENDNSAK